MSNEILHQTEPEIRQSSQGGKGPIPPALDTSKCTLGQSGALYLPWFACARAYDRSESATEAN